MTTRCCCHTTTTTTRCFRCVRCTTMTTVRFRCHCCFRCTTTMTTRSRCHCCVVVVEETQRKKDWDFPRRTDDEDFLQDFDVKNVTYVVRCQQLSTSLALSLVVPVARPSLVPVLPSHRQVKLQCLQDYLDSRTPHSSLVAVSFPSAQEFVIHHR